MIRNKMSFEEACNIAYNTNLNPVGIGEYKEKTMHAALKNYYESDATKQEIKIDRFYADILNEYGVIEIQTRNFNTMREKLTCFLEKYDVTIVYPMVNNKYINWVNSENEKDYMRKSPRHDNLLKAMKELYKIKQFLNNERLHFVFEFCDMVELKNLDGWNKTKKKGSSSINKVPLKIDHEIIIDKKEDYLNYIEKCDSEFSVKDFCKKNKCSERDGQLALNIFRFLELVELTGKDGRRNLYRFIK